MKRAIAGLLLSFTSLLSVARAAEPPTSNLPRAKRLVLIMVDGLNADLLYSNMSRLDPDTGKPVLPWIQHVFGEGGAVFDNFYTRGISLSAPSWSMLNTGHHTVIRGNVEYDRYTGQVYDYLNFFPFYVGYARRHQEDMPGVEVLDEAGIPLVIDSFPYQDLYQSFQLYQRGVRWETLEHVLKRRFSSKVLLSTVENAGSPSLDEIWAQQTEDELKGFLTTRTVAYLDFFTGDLDHEGHATSQPEALLSTLKHLDGLIGRLWTAIQKSPLKDETVFAMVSDHGMNNVPGVTSQGFSLPDLFNSPQGGGQHVITNRHQFDSYKLSGLDPLVHRVITPSTASTYLTGQANDYPTAWLDLDGNERASVLLRNNDWNRLHILLLQLARQELTAPVRAAAVDYFNGIVAAHRGPWSAESRALREELKALENAIAERRALVQKLPKKWTAEQRRTGQDKAGRRLADQLAAWEREESGYADYLNHVDALLALQLSPDKPFTRKVNELIPELSLGDPNSVADLRHYVVGPAPPGLLTTADGKLDAERSFRYVDYFSLLAAQRVRNNPQPDLSSKPVDFLALRLPPEAVPDVMNSYWLYGDDENQLLILQRADGAVAVRPVRALHQQPDAHFAWEAQNWRAGLPLALFEDGDLSLPPGTDRVAWLSAWHTEREWLEAIHKTHYSNGVLGVIEQFSPVGPNVPGTAGVSPVLLRYERRRRELVEPDFQVFAASHWNFNVRNVNPGGNHGAFFRISTHSVWMMAGAGLAPEHVTEPYDSLNFASTLLNLVGKPVPMPDHVVKLK